MHVENYLLINKSLFEITDNPKNTKLNDAEWRIYASLNYVIIDSDNGLTPSH